MRRQAHAVVTLVAGSLLGCASGGGRSSAVFASSTVAPAQRAGGATTGDALRPGDVVRLRIWREPDLSGEFPIDETGVAVLPKVGPVQLTGEPSPVMRAKLVARYAAFLSHESIDVTFLRRVQILGAVRQPGVYPIDPTMTIGDALAVAGGTTAEGDPNKLELIRGGQRLPGRVLRQSLIGESRVRSGDQIFVPERSWVRRNSGFLVGTAVTAAVSIVLTLSSR